MLKKTKFNLNSKNKCEVNRLSKRTFSTFINSCKLGNLPRQGNFILNRFKRKSDLQIKSLNYNTTYNYINYKTAN